jgi:pimeloyl-ACP methyl ester carboxylesterase
MNRRSISFRVHYAVCIAAIFGYLSGTTSATELFASHDASVDGVTLHYTIGGSGPAVLLLHGFAETSRMWNPILPLLGAKFTVIAPDLPGIGDSSIPNRNIDMKTAAIQIHDLVRSLGITNARVVGHDIGLMVAYA